MHDRFRSLEVALTQVHGWHLDVGSPVLFYWLHVRDAVLWGNPAFSGRALLLARGGPDWKEYSSNLTEAQAAEIFQALDQLGLPAQHLEVTGENDASEGWGQLTLRINLQDGLGPSQPHQVSLYPYTGFTGADAPRFREFLLKLLLLPGEAVMQDRTVAKILDLLTR